MPILLLLLLALISQLEHWPREYEWGGLVVTVLVLAGSWLVGHVITAYACRAMRRHPGEARRVLRKAHRSESIYFIALIVGYLLTLYFSGLGYSIRHWVNERDTFVPGREFALLAPLFVAMICSWARFYDLEKTAHDVEWREAERWRQEAWENGRKEEWEKWRMTEGEVANGNDAASPPLPIAPSSIFPSAPPPFLGRWVFVVLQARFNLLFIALPLVLLPAFQAIDRVSKLLPDSESYAFLLMFASLVLTMVSIPWLLRLFLGLKPLPPGPTRDRLESISRRLSFRCSNILVWNTRHSSANAMVTGMVPWARYIVLTDRLLSDLSDDEVDAVLGHEIGHVKHHHMFFFALFLIISVCAVHWLGVAGLVAPDKLPSSAHTSEVEPPAGYDSIRELLLTAGSLAAVSAYIYFAFGWLSRSCERQADLFAVRVTSAGAFIGALEKVARLNGIPRENPGWFASWRHPPIARRVEFVREMELSPHLARRFHRRIGLVKWSMTAVLVVVILAQIWVERKDAAQAKDGSRTEAPH